MHFNGQPDASLRDLVSRTMRENPRRIAAVVVLQLAAALAQATTVLLLVPLLAALGVGEAPSSSSWIGRLFDLLGSQRPLLPLLALYAAATAAAAALGAWQAVLVVRHRLAVADRLRGELANAVAATRWDRLVGLRQSDLLAALTAHTTWVGLGVGAALTALVTVAVIVAQVVASSVISLPMTALALGSTVALVVGMWPLVRRSRALGGETTRASSELYRRATTFLEGLKLVKAYGLEKRLVAEIEDTVAEGSSTQVALARATGGATVVQVTAGALLLCGSVYLAANVIDVPARSLLAVAFAFSRIVGQVAPLQTSLYQVGQSLPALDVTTATIRDCEKAADSSAAPQGPGRLRLRDALQVVDVRFTYPPRDGVGADALVTAELTVPARSITAFAGPSGAGKTTLADVLAGLLVPQHGALLIDAEPLTPDRLPLWRRSVAIVPQEPWLFHDSIEANLRWSVPDADESELWEALAVANLDSFVRGLPDGLRTVVGTRGVELSGGERQRVALARAILRSPELLVLDEATNSLDGESELAIRTALAALRGRLTTVLVAHGSSMLRLADQVVVLDAGRVVETGTWAELSAGGGRLSTLISAAAAGPPVMPAR